MKDKFMKEYAQIVGQEFDNLKSKIAELKLTFQLTTWTDMKSMIEAANEIYELNERLVDYTAIHKIILENYKTGE